MLWGCVPAGGSRRTASCPLQLLQAAHGPLLAAPSSLDVTSLCFPGHVSDFLPPSFIYWNPRGLSEPTGTIQSASHLKVSVTAPVKHRSPRQVTDPWDSSTDSCRALILPALTIMPMRYFRKGCITLLYPWLMTFN